MSEQVLEVPTPAVLRDALEAAVIRDLLGPAGGPEEELDEAPRERYLLGMLAPRRQIIVQQTLDDLAIAGEDAAEDGPDEGTAPAAATMFPSSFGFTFAVDSRARALRVVVRGGRYERRESSAAEGAGRRPAGCRPTRCAARESSCNSTRTPWVGGWPRAPAAATRQSSSRHTAPRAGCVASAGAQRVDLVWTGPDVSNAYRHTQPALLDLVGHAKQRLTIVSFVTYKVPAVTTAIADAARRGVEVRLVVEDAEASRGKVAFDALAAFGPDVAGRCGVFVWPADRRARDAAGHHGSLHAKCAVADRSWLLISSANLTEFAFTLDIELGVLVRGGSLPERGERSFDDLIATGVLRAIGS